MLKLQEVNSGQTLETQQPASKFKSQGSPLKLLLKNSINQEKKAKAPTDGTLLNQPSVSQLDSTKKTKSKDSIRKNQSKETIRKNKSKEAIRQSREIVSFPQVEIIQSRQRRSASKEILTTRKGGRKRAQKHFSSNLS